MEFRAGGTSLEGGDFVGVLSGVPVGFFGTHLFKEPELLRNRLFKVLPSWLKSLDLRNCPFWGLTKSFGLISILLPDESLEGTLLGSVFGMDTVFGGGSNLAISFGASGSTTLGVLMSMLLELGEFLGTQTKLGSFFGFLSTDCRNGDPL